MSEGFTFTFGGTGGGASAPLSLANQTLTITWDVTVWSIQIGDATFGTPKGANKTIVQLDADGAFTLLEANANQADGGGHTTVCFLSIEVDGTTFQVGTQDTTATVLTSLNNVTIVGINSGAAIDAIAFTSAS